MGKKVWIDVKTQFVGIHNWANCTLPEVAFLKSSHRHIFYVTVSLPVDHTDRELEFFVIQNEIRKMIDAWHCTDRRTGIILLGSKSCEMIADSFVNDFRKRYPDLPWIRVTVSEDDENRATVMWERD